MVEMGHIRCWIPAPPGLSSYALSFAVDHTRTNSRVDRMLIHMIHSYICRKYSFFFCILLGKHSLVYSPSNGYLAIILFFLLLPFVLSFYYS